MKQKSFVLTTAISLMLIIALASLSGCSEKPDTPPPKAPATEPVTTEKEFLSSPEVAVCDLNKTKISKLELSKPPSFVRRMEREKREDLKEGTITLGGTKYKVLVGDKTEREFHLLDIDKNTAPYWWGSWSLNSKHLLNGKFYEFMLIENGDKLAGRPYTGELGTFKVGKGSRQVEKIEVSGSLMQANSVSVPVGYLSEARTKPVTQYSLPVGDYTPYILAITYDGLRVQVSNNYYTNAQGQPSGADKVYGIAIRKDKPYVLDFSNEPTIIFESPKKENTSFTIGQEVKISAVLIDPKLDIMIRGLDDTSNKIKKEYKDRDGNVTHTAHLNKSLDPTVVIARSDGEIVGEGIMPFG